MNFTGNPSRTGKIKIKCFDCRKAFPVRDGDWHQLEVHQVFLCSSCEKKRKKNSQQRKSLNRFLGRRFRE